MLALGPSPTGFTMAHFTAKVQSITGLPDGHYTHRQAAYDLKKLRAKDLITRHGRSRRYQSSLPSMRAVPAVLVLCEHVIRPILAGVHSPPRSSTPTTWTKPTSTTNTFDSACSRFFRSSVSQHRQHRCRSRLAKRSLEVQATDIDESMKLADAVAAATREAGWASGVARKPQPPDSALAVRRTVGPRDDILSRLSGVANGRTTGLADDELDQLSLFAPLSARRGDSSYLAAPILKIFVPHT